MEKLSAKTISSFKDNAEFYYLTFFFSILYAAFFWFSTDLHRGTLYVGGLVGIAFSLSTLSNVRINFKALIKNPLFITATTFLAYSSLSVFWSDPDNSARTVKFLKTIFIMYPLLYLFLRGVHTSEKFYSTLTSAFIWSSVAMSVVVMINHFIINDYQIMRLYGLGRTENPVALGLLTGLAALLLTFPDQFKCPTIKNKYIRFLVMAVLVLTMLLSFSRGPVLAFGATVCLILCLQKKYKAVFSIVALGIVFLITMYWEDISNSNFFERGSSGRLDSWKAAITYIQEKPIFGHGVATKFIYDIVYMGRESHSSHAHSVYLSHFIQGGFVGFALLMTTYLAAFDAAIKAFLSDKTRSPLIFLSMGAILGLFDFGGFHTNLGQAWLVFWLPIAYLVSYELMKMSSQRSKTLSA